MSAPSITIRQSKDSWKVFDLRGTVSTFQWRDVAVAAAYKMLGDKRGLILICDTHGQPIETIDLRTHDPKTRDSL